MKKTAIIVFFIATCIVIFSFSFDLAADNIPQKSKKKALIFGITGQDGAYLTEFLLKQNYEVHGVKRRSSSINTIHIDRFYEELQKKDRSLYLYYGDLNDSSNIIKLIQTVQPDEIYNLAAQSHVKVSFELPEYTANIDALGPLRILEGIKLLGLEKKTKYYQASSSEMFGKVLEIPQTESTPFYPRSPYGIAKLFAYWMTINYREAYEMYACNGILFNHESPFRGETFVTRKITMAACKRKLGQYNILYLGNLNAKRDWGYAKDYVEAMWLMLQQDKPDDYVIASGETHSVREFVELAYKELGFDIEWHGEGANEYGIDKKTGEILIKVDPIYYRPTEVDFLLGNASKAKQILKWIPKTSFHELIKIMIESDLKHEQDRQDN
jgi:GDPmannose 4,6-dehydratase